MISDTYRDGRQRKGIRREHAISTARISDVPVIDITPFRTGTDPASVAAAVDRAATHVGFMQIVGHGIPTSATAALSEAMDAFFGLPLEEKLATRPSSSSINRGYSARKTERLSHSLGVYSPDDLFEAFNFGSQAADYPMLDLPTELYAANLWPGGVPVPGLTEWFTHAGSLARTMTEIFALALDLPRDYFRAYQHHSIDVLRLNNYQVPPDDTVLEPGQVGMGAHTDFGIVTILWADAVRGLQILDDEGAWHDVVPAEGALLINLGDLLARWTNDRWISTMHRVLAPVDDDGRLYRRRSAAYFHDGDHDAVIRALPGTGEARYEPTTVAEHLAQKLAGSRGLRLNTSAEREASRLLGTGRQ
ncbi:2-oxoglutarate and iron-dependent oxygenase domain-containing protein [Streptomyces sp. NPDC047081]|uniref:isopenicillin N synthase family dioxygenase n=1 Tax=Streptomyces sp. NPDC047081 TaxID=3154706 RepID=UPI0033F908B0